MKEPSHLPSVEQALRTVETTRAMLAQWQAPVCRGHLYPMRIQRGRRQYLYYTWERCVNGTRIQRTVRVDQVERIAAGIRAMAGFQARLERYCAACEMLALVEGQEAAGADEKKSLHYDVGRGKQGRRPRCGSR